MFVNLSQRKTKSSRNMSFLGTDQVRLNHCEGREDPDRLVRWGRAQVAVAVVAVEEAGAEVVDMVEEGEVEAGTPVTGLSRTRTKLRGATTTGNGVMTRRWRGEGRHLRSIIAHRCAAEL